MPVFNFVVYDPSLSVLPPATCLPFRLMAIRAADKGCVRVTRPGLDPGAAPTIRKLRVAGLETGGGSGGRPDWAR